MYQFDGNEKALAHGVYPDVGLKDARERRDAARKLLANDIYPAENRKIQAAAKVERSADSFEVIARLENDIFPWLGGKAVHDH